MASVSKNVTIKEYQSFVQEVYGLPDDRQFSAWDMLSNVERFLMRGLKGIRKENKEKTKFNLIISTSWLMSLLNQLHIDIEEELWQRFPYVCSYCASCPCECKQKRPESRQHVPVDNAKRPKTFSDFQKMFREIYPPETRTLEHAGIHLAEEMGEVSEAILAYRSTRDDAGFKNVTLEIADLISCLIGVFNSMSVDLAEELSIHFADNCHVCHKSPCECSFNFIVNFKS